MYPEQDIPDAVTAGYWEYNADEVDMGAIGAIRKYND